jgi:uncharacterized protein
MFPKNDRFFDLFNNHAENLVRGVALMRELCHATDRRTELVGAIREVEHVGDKITREIQKLLIRSFITPLDREDIHALSSSMDDVIDYIDEAANLFLLFRVHAPVPDYIKQVDLLSNAVGHLADAVGHMRTPKTRIRSRAALFKVYDLESEGDAVYNRALAQLFDNEPDPKTILKWKELHGDMEGALDACQTVANTLEMIVLKSI